MNGPLNNHLHNNEETSSEIGFVYHQSVGLMVKMASPKNISTADGFSWSAITEGDERVSLIVVLIVSAIILLLILLIIGIWRCFLYLRSKANEDSNVEAVSSRFVIPNIPSHSVFLDPKTGQFVYDSRAVPSPEPANPSRHWYYQNHLITPSNSGNTANLTPHSVNIPANQLLCLKVADEGQPKTLMPEDSPSSSLPPQISEFNPKSASSTVLEEDGGLWNIIPEDASSTLKTRSLPACVRSKLKQSASADNSNDLYSKVNFSKKRKNRMRNDEAAIIAISKSRSQYLHRDTDSLVDNEAIIVYDERTAL